jgi:hypothetical protein
MKEISNIFRYSILISAKEAGVFLRELLQKDPTNLLYNSIISLAYKNLNEFLSVSTRESATTFRVRVNTDNSQTLSSYHP